MSDERTTAIERLETLLDEKDRELSEAASANERLENELRGSRNGWRRATELPPDDLPVPRLELAYVQIDEWREYRPREWVFARQPCDDHGCTVLDVGWFVVTWARGGHVAGEP